MSTRMQAPAKQHQPESEALASSRQPQLLQRHATSKAIPEGIPPIVHEVLQSPGQPLDPVTRMDIESRFGEDFSGVRVHTDGKAAESAQALNANAYTVNRDVVFDAGKYAPNTQIGKRLLAHELAHVVQQGRGGSNQSMLLVGSTLEQSADQVAAKFTQGVGTIQVIGSSAPRIARQSKEKKRAIVQGQVPILLVPPLGGREVFDLNKDDQVEILGIEKGGPKQVWTRIKIIKSKDTKIEGKIGKVNTALHSNAFQEQPSSAAEQASESAKNAPPKSRIEILESQLGEDFRGVRLQEPTPAKQASESAKKAARPSPVFSIWFSPLYVDRFTDIVFDPSYREETHKDWLQVFYSDGTKIDINMDDIGDESFSSNEAINNAILEAKPGDGGRLFPSRMNQSTTPLLWHEKEEGRASFTIGLQIQGAMTGLEAGMQGFGMTFGPGLMGAAQARVQSPATRKPSVPLTGQPAPRGVYQTPVRPPRVPPKRLLNLARGPVSPPKARTPPHPPKMSPSNEEQLGAGVGRGLAGRTQGGRASSEQDISTAAGKQPGSKQSAMSAGKGEIGQRFKTFEEAEKEAARLQQLRPKSKNPPHVLGVIVKEGSKTKVWYEVSKEGIGMLGHTEQAALSRMDLKPGMSVDFVGHYPPCPLPEGCINFMNQFAIDKQVYIRYRYVHGETNTSYYEFLPGIGHIKQKDIPGRGRNVLH